MRHNAQKHLREQSQRWKRPVVPETEPAPAPPEPEVEIEDDDEPEESKP